MVFPFTCARSIVRGRRFRVLSLRDWAMRFELHLPGELPSPVTRAYDPELDDVRSILADVCELASDAGRFIVAGFGQDRWAVDVSTDLLVLMEQLPEAFIAMESGAPFAIDFYEQGI